MNSTTPATIQERLRDADCIYSEQAVEQAIDAMVASITQAMAELNPIVMCVMNGGIVLTGKLLPRLPFALQFDYLHVSRYHNTQQGSDDLRWLARPQFDLANRHLLIVDDILDEGLTLRAILDYCERQRAASVSVAVLVEKQHRRRPPEIKADFCGLTVPDRYVFGYGMDCESYWRNLPGIYAVKESR